MSRYRRMHVRTAMVLALAMAACATGSQEEVGDPFNAPVAGSDEVLLTVENNDFRDANIFAYWDGTARDRVGFVVGKTSRTFRMPWRSERMQIGVDFVGRGGYRTEHVDVWAGDHLNFVIIGR